jgi:hypothetical protein
MKRTCCLTVLIVIGACGAPEPEVPATGMIAQEMRQNQGTVLEGNAVHVHRFGGQRGGVPFGLTGVDGTLQTSNGKSGADPWLVGATLQGVDRQTGAPVELRIVRACAHRRPPQNWIRPLEPWDPPDGCDWPDDFQAAPGQHSYVVERRPPGGPTWAPLCKGWNRALPHGGTWNATGGHDVSSTQFIFACIDNVVVKCTNWGYAPWRSYIGNPLWSYHQSCTRMAMADYCGNGKSYTEERTQIDLSDKLGFRAPDMDLPFEAGWKPGGALCLSKLRWQTLKPGGNCPTVPDPRRHGGAPPCDGYSDRPGLIGLGAHLFSGSAFVDKGLWRWQNGDDAYTTTSGYWSSIPADLQRPAPGYDMFGFEGAVFSPTAPPEVRPLADVPLYSYRSTGGRHLTTTQATPPAGYGDQVLEGYIYPPSGGAPTASAARLVRYQRGVTDVYLTTTRPPPPGFGSAVDQGWLPRGP